MHPPKRQTSLKMLALLALALVAATAAPSHSKPGSLAQYTQQHAARAPTGHPDAPTIMRFEFMADVREGHRASVLCTVASGEAPYTIQWYKDGYPIGPEAAHLRNIQIKPDSDQSTLKVQKVALEHAGNYTCLVSNRFGTASHSATLQVLAQPRWVREPPSEPIVATSGHTVVIECLSTGWPKPQLSWFVKTPNRHSYEPLLATGRISLAHNGSLVIRNADKSDEANYLCRATNNIGKPLEHSSPLKVNVPAHFEAANKLQSQTVRRQHDVTLRCDAKGDEPIQIEWYKNKQLLQLPAEPAPPVHPLIAVAGSPYRAAAAASSRSSLLTTDPRYNVASYPYANGVISVLIIKQTSRQDNALFECVTHNQVGRDKLSIDLAVEEEPDSIQELQASQTSARSVALVWSEPYDGRSPIHKYIFEYKRAPTSSQQQPQPQHHHIDSDMMLLDQHQHQQHHSDTEDWSQAARISMQLAPFASVSPNNQSVVRTFTIGGLEPATRYLLRAIAENSIGSSKWSQPLEFSSDEEAPDVAPTNVHCRALNSTSIEVTWDNMAHVHRHQLSTKIHGYYVGYRLANSSFVHKPYATPAEASANADPAALARLDTQVSELRRDTQYEIAVQAFNSRGTGPSSDYVTCRTMEMEAPKPVRLQVRHESNDTIHIEWHRDQADLQNPIDDYILYQEKNSASQQWLQVRLPGNQTQYRAPSLKCGTRYQFYVIAQNKIGKSAPSDVVSASTSGSAPDAPTKQSLINMVNSTCLQINLNAFHDKGCRIKTYTLRYKLERLHTSAGATTTTMSGRHNSVLVQQQLVQQQQQSNASDWVNVRPSRSSQAASNSNWRPSGRSPVASYPQSSQEDDKIEYLCDLSPVGEYTIHVTATNDVGRTEVEYSVLMSSDELRYSFMRDLLAPLAQRLPHLFAYIPSVLVFMLAGLFLSLAGMALYATSLKYYQKFVIMQNQRRAMRRAKMDERRRRRNLSGSRMSQKHGDLWAENYDADDGDNDTDDDDQAPNIVVGTRNHLASDDDDNLGSDEDTQTVDYDVNITLNGNTSSNSNIVDIDDSNDCIVEAAGGHRNRQHHQLAKSRRHDRDYRKPPPLRHFRTNSNPRNNQELNVSSTMSMMMMQQHQQQHHLAHRHHPLQQDNDTDGGVSDARTCSTMSSHSTSRSQLARLSRQSQMAAHHQQQQHHHHQQSMNNSIYGTTKANNGHYMTNLAGANAAFDSSSMDSCNRKLVYGKFGAGSCGISTASTDSAGSRRFQCLNSKQFVKMNEYSMLPTISAAVQQQRPPVADIYGTLAAAVPQATNLNTSLGQAQPQPAYSTLRRTSMQTYVPNQQRQPTNPIYGYYVAPKVDSAPEQHRDEFAANSIFVPPQQQQQQQQPQPPQIVYSAPNIRIKQPPVFL